MQQIFVWTPADLVGIAFFTIVFLCWLVTGIVGMIYQARCKHPRVYEDRAFCAICSKCGKNLGFIGDWRRNQGSRK